MQHETKEISSGSQKTIALIAHDHKKEELMAWVKDNVDILKQHKLCGTGTTGTLIREKFGLDVKIYLSGPIGGDLQIGSEIASGNIDILVFFWDPLEMQPHDPDVKALLRVAVLHDCIVVTNRSTADFVFSSPLLTENYQRAAIDYSSELKRRVAEFKQE